MAAFRRLRTLKLKPVVPDGPPKTIRVRSAVALDKAAPASALAYLARDQIALVRRSTLELSVLDFSPQASHEKQAQVLEAGRRPCEAWIVIHHISIPATDTRHVAEVLVELFDGLLTGFGPYRDSYIAWAVDDRGSAIEVYPVGTEMYPPQGHGQAGFATTRRPRRSWRLTQRSGSSIRRRSPGSWRTRGLEDGGPVPWTT